MTATTKFANKSTGKAAAVQQNYQLVLYKRALHPETFQMKARQVVRHATAELEAWLMAGSHLLRFRNEAFCTCELVTDREGGIPTTGAVAAFPCSGEKDYEHPFTDAKVNYLTTVTTETLPESLYLDTYNDMSTLADETEAMVHKWTDTLGGGGPCLSMIEINRYPREIHAHCYHLNSASGLVVRTETVFEVKP